MSDKIFYSVSTLRQYSQCPARNVYKMMERRGEIKSDPSLPFVFGIAGHEAIESFLKNGEEPKSAAQSFVKANLLEKFTVQQLQGYGITPDDIQDKQNHLDKCLDNFTNKIMPRLNEANPGRNWAERSEVKYAVNFREGELRGVIDMDLDYQTLDWKLGAKVPGDEFMSLDPQPPVYYHMKQLTSGTAPGRFAFVYPVGRPTLQIQDGVFKSGPRKGQPKMSVDTENGLQFKFDVMQDDDKVARMFNDYINPWAEAYENGIVWKNPGYQGPTDKMPQNCKSCSYRTDCRSDYLKSIRKEDSVIDLISGGE